MLSSFGSRITSMVTQPSMLAVAAGVLTGAIAGTAMVSAGIPFAKPSEPEKVTLQACPGAGPVLAHIAGGRTMLVTARSVDGRWMEVYLGEPGIDRAWAPASALSLQASGDGLPVGGCEGVPLPTPPPPTPGPTLPPGATPSPEPTPAVTAVVTPSPGPTLKPGTTASPTPKPTATPKPTPTRTPTPTAVPTPVPTAVPTPSPTPIVTPPPDLTAPSITNVSINGAWTSGDGNYYIYGPAASGCPYHSATISATVTDTGGSGLAGYTVTLRWKDPYGAQYNQQMSYNLGTHLYNKTINAVDGWPENAWIQYWITASDNAGNLATTSSPPDGSHWLFTGQCLV